MIIKKIIHISDIHIRNYKRHKEYINVFKNLFKILKNRVDETTIIVLAGDIVHSKNEMTPELVSMVATFFKQCADLCPTILILGNHDINLNNENRLDSLTPIVNTLQHPNLHYWKESGIYDFHNVSFSVCSILGGIDKWPNVNELKNDFKIALHHGSVNSAITELGHEIINDAVKINIFNGYDFVLLGDIHKLQTLQYYSNIEFEVPMDDLKTYTENGFTIIPNDELKNDVYKVLKKTPLVSYSSSLIQQNYGETINNHGILMWDLENHTNEFIPIDNDIAYVTIDVKDGKIITPKEAFNLFPNNIRLRVKYENTNYNELNKIISLIKRKYTVVEVVKKKIHINSILNNNKLDIIGNVRDIEYQNKLLEEYLSEHSNEKYDIDSIRHINRVINSKVEKDKIPLRNIIWKPTRFEFSNMFSYGENNVIDINNYNGLIGIFAKNANGKSNILNSLTYCLFDKSPTAWKAKDVLNVYKDNFKCKLTFEINDVEYQIERIGLLNKKNNTVKVLVNFYKVEDNELISLNGEDRDDTNKNIRNYIGTYDDFLMTAFSTQVDNKNIIFKSQRERKDLLNSFLDTTIYDKLYEIARDEIKEKQINLKILNNQFDISKICDLTKKLEEDKLNYSNLKDKRDRIFNKVKEVNKSIKILNSELHPIDEVIDIDDVNNQLTVCKEKLKEKNTKQKDLTKENNKIEKEILKLDVEISGYDIDLLETSENIKNDLNIQLINKENELSKLNLKTSHYNSLINKLKDHKYDENCVYCVNNEFVQDAYNAKDKVNKLLNEKSKFESDINELKEKLKENEKLCDEYLSYKKLLNLYTSKLNLSQENYNEIVLIKSDIDRLKTQVDLYRSKKQLFSKQRTNQYKNDKIKIEIDNLELEINKLDNDYNNIQTELERCKVIVSKLESELTELNSMESQIFDLNKSLFQYEQYIQAINKDGIPSHLIRKVLPLLQEEINNILSNIVEFNILLEFDEKNINIYIMYPGGKKYVVELSSGMERFITSIATRVALMSITTIPKPNFLAIDEGFGVADSEMVSLFPTLFGVLKSDYDFIILISHLDVIRDMVDTSITVRKVGVGELSHSEII